MNQDGVGLMRLDLSPLEYAVAQLEDGLVLFDSDIVRCKRRS